MPFWEDFTVWTPTRVEYIDFFTLSNLRCGAMEIEWLKCADKVGLINSREKCKEVFDDFQECAYQKKTRQRVFAIRKEQIVQGRSYYNIPDDVPK